MTTEARPPPRPPPAVPGLRAPRSAQRVARPAHDARGRAPSVPRLRAGRRHPDRRRRLPAAGRDRPRRGGGPVGSAARRDLRPARLPQRLHPPDGEPDPGRGRRGRSRQLRAAPDGGGPGHHHRGGDADRRGAGDPGLAGRRDAGPGPPRAGLQPAHRRLADHVHHVRADPGRGRDGSARAARRRRHPARRRGREPGVEGGRGHGPHREPDLRRDRHADRVVPPGHARDRAQGRGGLPGHRQALRPHRRAGRRDGQEGLHHRPAGPRRAADHGLPRAHAQRHPGPAAEPQGDPRHERRQGRRRDEVRRGRARPHLRPVHRRRPRGAGDVEGRPGGRAERPRHRRRAAPRRAATDAARRRPLDPRGGHHPDPRHRVLLPQQLRDGHQQRHRRRPARTARGSGRA